MTVYLMRHGEPTYRDTVALGLPGMGAELGQLTPEGIQQAEEAAKDPRIQGTDLIVSSPYPRALQTAAIVSRQIDRPLEVAVGLHEWLPRTDYAAASHADIKESWHEYMRNAGVHTPQDRFPDWETHASMRKRAREAILPYLARTDLETLLIVCHGGIMRALTDQPSLPKIRFCEIMELTPEMIRALNTQESEG
ncbi:MAG: histidine phosphatase family protein [Oscillospiraceae bacterium]|nr:histidine phosphatase family protein [Oscillospiraceae bacterium]MBR5723330.1 histidine phosphatase family protein [Oscillospiraceae bacterium]